MMDYLTGFKLFASSHECSPESYVLLYAWIGMATVISVGGFLVWRRFIRTRTGMTSLPASSDGKSANGVGSEC